MPTLRIHFLEGAARMLKRLGDEARWRVQQRIERFAFSARQGDAATGMLVVDEFTVAYSVSWEQLQINIVAIHSAPKK